MSHPAKIEHRGNVYDFGRRKTKADARAVERDARSTLERTGRVEGARSVRPRPQRRTTAERLVTNDAYLWYSSHFDNQRDTLTPEQHLMRGVLLDAIHALRDTSAKGAPAHRAAVRWFRDDGRGYLFSFATICDEFGISLHTARLDLLYGGREPAGR